MKINTLRTLLKSGRPSLGTHLQSSWPTLVEVVGQTGLYDYVEFVAEYAPFDLFSLENWCRAAELCALSTMIKVDPEPRHFLAQRAIGCGFQSVLFTNIRSAEEVEHCVRVVRPATPVDGGLYGASMRRFVLMGCGTSPEHLQMLRDIVVGVMIEKQSAYEQLDEILSVPGLDMISIGLADLALNMGWEFDRTSGPLRQAESQIIAKSLARGIPVRIDIRSADEARYYLDMGIQHFCMTNELSILYRELRKQGETLREIL